MTTSNGYCYYEGYEPLCDIPDYLYKYEITITFNPKFYPLGKACSYVKKAIYEVVKASNRYIAMENKKRYKEGREFVSKHFIEYCVEYHNKDDKEGKLHYPHVHATLHSEVDIDATKLYRLEQNLRNKFGRTTIYYTDIEDKYHKNDHFEGLWSEYLLKDVIENEVNGKRHYFKIDLNQNYFEN